MDLGQITPEAETFQPINDLLALGKPKQHGPVFSHMDQVVRGQWIATIGDLLSRSCLCL